MSHTWYIFSMLPDVLDTESIVDNLVFVLVQAIVRNVILQLFGRRGDILAYCLHKH